MKKLKAEILIASTFIIYNRDVSLLYKEKNFNNSWIITQSLGINYNHKQDRCGFNGSVSYNKIQYSFTVKSKQRIFYTELLYRLQLYIPEIRDCINEFDYTINSGLSDGFDQNVPYWNAASLTRY
jgi:hypothetical protein